MHDVPLDQVLHGDCVEWMNRLPPNSVDLIFADPPYNLQLDGDLWRPNNTRVDAVAEDWDRFESFEAYDAFTRAWLGAARRVLKETGTLWVIGSYHNIYRVGACLMDLGYWILNDVVWVKANPTPQMRGVRFCNAHETLLWAKRSKEQERYTFHYQALKAGNEDRQMRSDWYLPICSGSERRTVNGEKAHATQKPEALLHRILMATTNAGDVILDPFGGTGTTGAVARRLCRRFVLIEREERYVNVARERIADIGAVEPAEAAAYVQEKRPRIPFASVVECGLLPPGTVLALSRTEVRAIVHADGTVAANGMRGSIHRLASLCLGVPTCNGWTHWLFEDGAGSWRPIDALRDRLR